jgi:hypothetical protein
MSCRMGGRGRIGAAGTRSWDPCKAAVKTGHAARCGTSGAAGPAKRQIWDRFGLWTAVAVALVVLAYAYPIHHLYMMHRYGSIGYSPF